MGKVIFDISMSLDRFIAGAKARPEAGWVRRFLSRTRKGAWLGAGITLFLLFWWLYTIASNVPLD